MRECLSLHVGGAGVRVGAACWELFCLEHGIASSGLLTTPREEHRGEALTAFFTETEAHHYTPRALLVDLESSAIDDIRRSDCRDLFPPDVLIAGKEDAGDCFARAYHNAGSTLITQTVMERLRLMTDECDSFQGFLLYHSLGGGTGSGLTAAVTEELAVEYPKLTTISYAVFPSDSRCFASPVQPYNCVLSAHASLPHTDCTFLLDNNALFNMCSMQGEISQPSLADLNSVIAQVVSSVTLALRFSGGILESLNEFPINLVPFPRLHFPLVSHAPVMPARANHQHVSAAWMTHACFNLNNHLLQCDPQLGKYAACCLLYRGNVTPTDTKAAITSVKANRKIRFVDWCPAGFKIATHPKEPQYPPASHLGCPRSALTLLAASSAVSQAWAAVTRKFDLLFSRRAFLHWYLKEGMEAQHFMEAREDLVALQEEYKDMFESCYCMFSDSDSFFPGLDPTSSSGF